MASTYRDHIVLCGIGHLGYRVLEQLLASHIPVVALEKNGEGRFVDQAKATGVPVLIRDMKDDKALMEAGVPYARAIVIATNDDMANLEVALDARRMNPKIRVVMRLFDQQIAQKISGALMVDAAFSASALAAPFVAALSLETKVISSTVIAGIPHVTCEMTVAESSRMAGLRIDDLEADFAVRVLARTPQGGAVEAPPARETTIDAGDVLVITCRAAHLGALAGAARPAQRSSEAPAEMVADRG